MNPLETYLKELSEIHSSGAAVKEISYYGPLANMLNEIGKTLKPKVKCIINLRNRAAKFCQQAGITGMPLFLTDEDGRALAVVILER